MVAPGVYAITPEAWPAEDILRVSGDLLAAGVVMMQLRSKHLDQGQREKLGERLLRRCSEQGVPLLINDDPRIAAKLGADGVHIGRDDGSISEARAVLGDQAWVGVSCYADTSRAHKLADAGASYIAFGAVYPTGSKATPHRAPLSLFREWDRPKTPTVAIGGLRADNAEPVIAAGARWLAMIGGIWSAADPAAEVRRLQDLFQHHKERTHA